MRYLIWMFAIVLWLPVTAEPQETTVWISIAGPGGAEEVEIGPEGGQVPYRLFVETDPAGTPGNVGLWWVLMTIETDLGIQQERVRLDPSFIQVFTEGAVGSGSFGRVSDGRTVDPDDILQIGGMWSCTRPPQLCTPRLGIAQGGPQPVARGHFIVPAAPVDTQFQAKLVDTLSFNQGAWVGVITGFVNVGGGPVVEGQRPVARGAPPDRILANALTIRVVDASPLPGDFDLDGDVDLADFMNVAECFTGPEIPVDRNCEIADLDWDGDVDLADIVDFAARFTGSR